MAVMTVPLRLSAMGSVAGSIGFLELCFNCEYPAKDIDISAVMIRSFFIKMRFGLQI